MTMVRVLVAGLGRQGRRHLRALGAMAGVEVVATVDSGTEGLAGIPHFASVDDAAASIGCVNGAVVALPSTAHAPAVATLLSAGVPTLVEKPIADSLADATEMCDQAMRTGVPLVVGHVERFNPAVQLVGAMLKAGSLGRPISITIRRVGLPPPNRSDVGVIHDLAVHDIDLVGVFTGAPVRLRAVAGWPRCRFVESAHLLLDADGVDAVVQANWRTPVRVRDFTVTTDTCYVEGNFTSQRVDVVKASSAPEFVDFAEFQSHYGSAQRVQLETRPAEPLTEELLAFVGLLRGEGHGGLASAHEGRRALAIADEALDRLLDG
jgi:UDP-N-acetylglucosamine 3-dehydrogenase